MRLDVIHAGEGNSTCLRESLRELQPDEQRPHEPRPDRRRHGVDLLEPAPGSRQDLGDHARKERNVRARSELRHDAAVLQVNFLRCDDMRQQLSIFHKARAGIVAGGLES